jgi:hypothetical protein
MFLFPLLLCSPDWLQSKWCFAELTSVKMTGKQIFPVVIADCDRSALGEYQAVFVNHESAEDRERSFNRLFRDLKREVSVPGITLPWPNPELTVSHPRHISPTPTKDLSRL